MTALAGIFDPVWLLFDSKELNLKQTRTFLVLSKRELLKEHRHGRNLGQKAAMCFPLKPQNLKSLPNLFWTLKRLHADVCHDCIQAFICGRFLQIWKA